MKEDEWFLKNGLMTESMKSVPSLRMELSMKI